MTSDMITLCTRSTTIFPFASETKVVRALPADVVVAKVVIERFRVCIGLGAVDPQTFVVRDVLRFRGGRWL